ncbi:putative parvulin-type peptidyl-prolyl cis-trans isomerase precursor [Roseovarius albus]|uniref:Parvulin-like PPIase n=1 Tax=Roseovarius albus TaxID=1247867 RepID=A0A1X6YSR7_9RHOB|nr:peptidylprolyl isomerase [Roseovarius albus]SLN30459.1 putative parvulin-type peptidyl-prolyl cis-trans isomerase precursor [Roseovarius albus]
MLFSRPLHPVFSLVAAGFLAFPAAAQESTDVDQVLAEVNGVKITLGHVIAQRSTLPQQYDQVDSKILFDGLLEQLIQQTLLMQSVDAEPSKLINLLIENERRGMIANQNSRDVLLAPIAPAEVEAVYNERYQSGPKAEEYNAAHILVEQEDEAKAIIAELDGGADFAALAQEKSIGPSGKSGGELGWFGAGAMVEPFFNGVTALDVGSYTVAPIKTDFGWHVILLKETREVEPPKLEEVAPAIEEELRTLALEAYLTELESKADVTRADTTELDPSVVNNFDLLEN